MWLVHPTLSTRKAPAEGGIQKMAQMEVGHSKGFVERTFEVSGASSLRGSSFPVECWLSVCDIQLRRGPLRARRVTGCLTHWSEWFGSDRAIKYRSP